MSSIVKPLDMIFSAKPFYVKSKLYDEPNLPESLFSSLSKSVMSA